MATCMALKVGLWIRRVAGQAHRICNLAYGAIQKRENNLLKVLSTIRACDSLDLPSASFDKDLFGTCYYKCPCFHISNFQEMGRCECSEHTSSQYRPFPCRHPVD